MMGSLRYPHIYQLLKRAGHSPAKAAEITLDAWRGDGWATSYILFWFRHRNRQMVTFEKVD